MMHIRQPARLLLGAVTLTTCSALALAEQGTVDMGNGTNGSSSSTVRINGKVVNSASGPGAMAETNIGSRRITTRGNGDHSSTIIIESDGSVTSVTSSSTGSAPPPHGRDFVNANLSGRNFSGANFAGRRFTNVDLSRANLQGADLRGAELTNVDLSEANLSGANLTGAKLVNTDLGEAVTTGVIWDGGPR